MREGVGERRFGTVAVEKGCATLEQIIEAMNIQIQEDIEKGEHRLLGMILVDMGVMNVAQVKEVLLTMGVPI